MKNNLMIILIIAGAVLGVVAVRMFFLNSFQIIGWNLFWKNLSRLNFDLFRLVFKSATFGKCFLGAIIGAGAGGVVAFMMGKK